MFTIAPIFRSFYIGENFSHILRLFSAVPFAPCVCVCVLCATQIASNTILLIKFLNSLWPEFRLFHTINSKRKCFLRHRSEYVRAWTMAKSEVKLYFLFHSMWATIVCAQLGFSQSLSLRLCCSVFSSLEFAAIFSTLHLDIVSVCVPLCKLSLWKQFMVLVGIDFHNAEINTNCFQ